MPGVKVYDATGAQVGPEYDTILAAFASVQEGYRIEVENGVYAPPPGGPEEIGVAIKNVVLTTTAFWQVDPTTGGRNSGAALSNEVVLKNVLIMAGDVTVNGFTIDGGTGPRDPLYDIGLSFPGMGPLPNVVITNNRFVNHSNGVTVPAVENTTVQGNYFGGANRVGMMFGASGEISFNVFENNGIGSDFNTQLLITQNIGTLSVHDNVFTGPTNDPGSKAITLFGAKNITIEDNQYTGANGIDVWQGDPSIVINEAATNFAITGSYVLLHPDALGTTINPTFLDVAGTFVLSDAGSLAEFKSPVPGGTADESGTVIYKDLDDALDKSLDGANLLISNDNFGAVTANLDDATLIAGAGSNANVLLGSGVNDLTLKGSGGLDVDGNSRANDIIGNAGSNDISGGAGNDAITAGAGNDLVDAGAGNDTIVGGSGAGNDRYIGGTGIDVVRYSSATQTITVNLTTGAAAGVQIGRDTLIGIENVIGGRGHDSVTGNGLLNVLTGGTGNDKLNGMAGNDVLVGGLGSDTLTGGLGRDVFDFNALAESTRGSARDTVNFQRREGDKIDLSTIDADTDGTAGNQAFRFVGAAAFSGVDGQLRFSGGILQGDTDGDRRADFEIKIVGAMLAGDVIL